jgi:hypothetical protein
MNTHKLIFSFVLVALFTAFALVATTVRAAPQAPSDLVRNEAQAEMLATIYPTATPCAVKPSKPSLTQPANGADVGIRTVLLKWKRTTCANSYHVVVKRGSINGTQVFAKTYLKETQITTTFLARGHAYYWRVQACNQVGCTNSAWFSFFIEQAE